MNDEGSGHGMAKVSRQAKPAEQGRCRRTQPADDLPGTGLEAKQPAVGRPRSKTTASRWPWPASRHAVQVDGGSAVVLATQEGGLRPTYLSLPHLSPLPVTVPTHSLNLDKTQFSPNLTFFVIFIIFIFLFTPPL